MAARHAPCVECGVTVHGGQTAPIPKRCPQCRRRHKARQAVAAYKPVVNVRQCVDCGASYEAPGRDTKSLRCPACRPAARARNRKEWAARNPESVRASKLKHYAATYTPHPTEDAVCLDCGTTFLALRKGNDKLRCPECDSLARREAHRDVIQRRRARLRGASVEVVRHRDVFIRDGYICQLCGLQIDPDTRFPDDSAATLDHIVPLSRGGEHSLSNTQCACWRCNRLKNNAVPSPTREGVL